MFLLKKRYLSYLFPLVSLFLISCSSTSINTSVSNNNYTGEQTNKKRVVALTSLTADLVNRLDSNSLLAIPGSRLLKKNVQFNDKIVVSQGRNPPNIEKIISLKPDLVIGAKGFHDKALSQINSLGVRTISTKIKNWNDLELIKNEISEYLDVENPSLYSYAPNCRQVPEELSYDSTIVLVSSSPLLSPNKNSWAGSLLNKFNVNNLIGDIKSKSGFDGYVTLSPETLLVKNPDNIILIDTGNDMKKLFLSKSYSSNLKAVKNNNVYNFNYYGLINPGSMKSIDNACEKLKNL